MTDENRRENIKLQVARSQELLRAATVLCDNDLHADAVSRCYYAMLHCALALLLTEGEEPRTHSAVSTLLNLRFVRTGKFPPSFTRALSHLEDDRSTADYDVSAIYTAADSVGAVSEAEKFCEESIAFLRREGWF